MIILSVELSHTEIIFLCVLSFLLLQSYSVKYNRYCISDACQVFLPLSAKVWKGTFGESSSWCLVVIGDLIVCLLPPSTAS